MAEDLDSLSAMWLEDSVIKESEITQAAIAGSKLHSKWLQILHRHNLRVKKLDNDYKKMRTLKWRYYSGTLDQAELRERGWPPFQYVLKADIDLFLEADDDLITIGIKKFYHQEVVDFCKAVIKELNNRTWNLRTAVDYLKYTAGH